MSVCCTLIYSWAIRWSITSIEETAMCAHKHCPCADDSHPPLPQVPISNIGDSAIAEALEEGPLLAHSRPRGLAKLANVLLSQKELWLLAVCSSLSIVSLLNAVLGERSLAWDCACSCSGESIEDCYMRKVRHARSNYRSRSYHTLILERTRMPSTVHPEALCITILISHLVPSNLVDLPCFRVSSLCVSVIGP